MISAGAQATSIQRICRQRKSIGSAQNVDGNTNQPHKAGATKVEDRWSMAQSWTRKKTFGLHTGQIGEEHGKREWLKVDQKWREARAQKRCVG